MPSEDISWLHKHHFELHLIKHCHTHSCLSCKDLHFYFTQGSCAKNMPFSHEHSQCCFTKTSPHTVVNPDVLDCPQRVMLISVFIEMLSKALRDSQQSMLCLGSLLFSPLELLLCLHDIHPHHSKEKIAESHLCNSWLKEVALR